MFDLSVSVLNVFVLSVYVVINNVNVLTSNVNALISNVYVLVLNVYVLITNDYVLILNANLFFYCLPHTQVHSVFKSFVLIKLIRTIARFKSVNNYFITELLKVYLMVKSACLYLF